MYFLLFAFSVIDISATPEVSVIIPVYNAEQYLERCLDSVLHQSFRNIEIICVNDGSQDGSIKILKKHQKNDKRIRIITQKNAGVSAARNCGLKAANGEFISFVDSDDMIHHEMLAIAMKFIKKHKVDMVMFNLTTKHFKPLNRSEIRSNILYTDTIIRHFDNLPFNVCWDKVYKKSAIKNIFFNEKISYCEDMLFAFQVFASIEKYVLIDAALYHYNVQNTSIVRSDFTRKKIDGLLIVLDNLFTNNYKITQNQLSSIFDDVAFHMMANSLRAKEKGLYLYACDCLYEMRNKYRTITNKSLKHKIDFRDKSIIDEFIIMAFVRFSFLLTKYLRFLKA